MSPAAFRSWRDSRKLSRPALAALLGVHTRTIELYETGRRRDNGKRVEIPKAIRLALAALAAGVLDYDGAASVGPPIASHV